MMGSGNTWRLENYKADTIEQNISSRKFIVPLYQRGLVWSEAKKEQFVDTLKRGLPFGSILLYHDEERNNYQIIDGLQRCNTIFEFIHNPAAFFSDEDVDEETVRRIVLCLGMNGSHERQRAGVKSKLLNWVRNSHPTMQAVEDMQYIDFGFVISETYPVAKGKEQEIASYIRPPLQKYKKICKDLLSIQIPAIVIEGDDSALPEIFERINSSGVKLDKYDIYAAAWTEKKFPIRSQTLTKLVEFNRDRYERMLQGRAALAGFEAAPFLAARELNAFEIAFGLGKYLSQTYPYLFSGKAEAYQTESAGFSLINACLGGKSADTKNMNLRLVELVGTDKMDLFLERIIQCVKQVDARIKKFNLFKANSRTYVGPLHTEYQVLSMIVFVFINRYAVYTFDDTGALESFQLHLDTSVPEWDVLAPAFKANAAKRYIEDILYHRWRGSGDKRLDTLQFNRDYYTKPITEDEFADMLRQWFRSDLAERNEVARFAPPKEAEKLLLSLIYLKQFSAQEHLDDSAYDIEHLAPKALMRRRLKTFSGQIKLPVSSIANLCLLPEKENRSKGEKTIYRDKKYLSDSKYTLQEIENHFTFTEQKDLDWLDDEQLGAEEFAARYHAYIQNRFQKLVKVILEDFTHI